MTGTSDSSKKRAAKLMAADPDYFKNIGANGGSAPHTEPRGYASNKIGPDGLTGVQRAQKLGEERKKYVEQNKD